MYSSFERLFRKSTFTYFLIFASYIFLSACEGIPRGDTKPVFTIKNLPVFKQDNLNVSDASQTEKQSNKILDSKEVDTEFLDPPNILNQTPSDFSITKSVEASKSDPLEKTITRDIQSNIEKTNEESSRGSNILEPNELSYTREDNENIEDIKDSMNLNIKPEYDEGEILKSEQTKNNKLASIIDIPQTKLQVPEVKKIKLISNVGKKIPIIYCANTSIGITLLLQQARQIASKLDNSWDIEVLETHHNKKVDAPSGTALALGRALAQGRSVSLSDVRDGVRDGNTGPRKQGNIGFSVLRGGDVAGEHSVIFFGKDERIELVHKANDRVIFARGALKAAQFIATKLNQTELHGYFTMDDVLV